MSLTSSAAGSLSDCYGLGSKVGGTLYLLRKCGCNCVDQDAVLLNSSKAESGLDLISGSPGATICEEALHVYGDSVSTRGCFPYVKDPQKKKKNDTDKLQEISQLD